MLFLGVEDTFWFLVAVTEKYFDRSYFDYALTGAQADQVSANHYKLWNEFKFEIRLLKSLNDIHSFEIQETYCFN